MDIPLAEEAADSACVMVLLEETVAVVLAKVAATKAVLLDREGEARTTFEDDAASERKVDKRSRTIRTKSMHVVESGFLSLVV